MANAWGNAWGGDNGAWGISWGSDPRGQQPAGSPKGNPKGNPKGSPPHGNPKGRKRRYILPNGLHIYGTADQAAAAATEMLGETVSVSDLKPVQRVSVGPMADVALSPDISPAPVLGPVNGPNRALEMMIAMSQMAAANAIAVEKLLEQWRTQKRRARLLVVLLQGA